MSASRIKAGHAFVMIGAIDDTARVLRKVNAKMNRFASGMTSLGQRMVTTATLAASPLAVATKTFAGFDDQMRKVRAVTGASEGDFKRLTDQAKNLGRTTSFTASQVAALQGELGKAGFSPDQILQQTPDILNLSRATDTDSSATAGIVASALRQFQLEASETTRVADALTATANGTFNTLESIGEALKFVGPIANQFNMSFEESLALIGALGNIGIQGSSAGAALRNIQLRASSLPQEFEKIGVATKDASGNLRNLFDILSDVDATTKSMGTADRAAVLNRLFGVRSVTGGSALSGDVGGIHALREIISGNQGGAARTAQEMDAGIGGVGRRLASAFEGVFNAIGKASEVFGNLVDQFSSSLPAVADWIEKNQELVALIAVLISATAASGLALIGLALLMKLVSLALVPLTAGFTLITTLLTALPAVIGFIASPAGMLIGLLALMLGGVIALTDGWGKSWANISGVFWKAWGGIVDRLKSGDLVGAGKIAFLGLKSLWSTILKEMHVMFLEFIESIAKLGLHAVADVERAFQEYTGKGDADEIENRLQLRIRAVEAIIGAKQGLIRNAPNDAQEELDELLNSPQASLAYPDGAGPEPFGNPFRPTGNVALLNAALGVQQAGANQAAMDLTKVVSTSLPETLEKGTAAAARKQFENQQIQILSAMSGAAQNTNVLLEDIFNQNAELLELVQPI